MSDIVCSSACTVTVVHELSIPPLQLTLAEGGAIAGAVLMVWAVGFGVRVVVQALKTFDAPRSDAGD